MDDEKLYKDPVHAAIQRSWLCRLIALSLLCHGALCTVFYPDSEPYRAIALTMRATTRVWFAIAVASGLAAAMVVVTIARGPRGSSARNFPEEQPGQDLVPIQSARRATAVQAYEVKLRKTCHTVEIQIHRYVGSSEHILTSRIAFLLHSCFTFRDRLLLACFCERWP